MQKICLILGDASGDGHEIKSHHYVTTNVNVHDFLEAYKKGAEVISFDLVAKVASDYGVTSMDEEEILLLKKHGYPVQQLENWEPYSLCEAETEGDEEEYLSDLHLQSEEFLDIYRFFVQTGYQIKHREPLVFEWSNSDVPIIEIGGYGFYR